MTAVMRLAGAAGHRPTTPVIRPVNPADAPAGEQGGGRERSRHQVVDGSGRRPLGSQPSAAVPLTEPMHPAGNPPEHTSTAMQSVTGRRPHATSDDALQRATTGWRRAYVEWRVAHAGDLDAVAEGVKREDTWRLVHDLIESALMTGFDRGRGTAAAPSGRGGNG